MAFFFSMEGGKKKEEEREEGGINGDNFHPFSPYYSSSLQLFFQGNTAWFGRTLHFKRSTWVKDNKTKKGRAILHSRLKNKKCIKVFSAKNSGPAHTQAFSESETRCYFSMNILTNLFIYLHKIHKANIVFWTNSIEGTKTELIYSLSYLS